MLKQVVYYFRIFITKPLFINKDAFVTCGRYFVDIHCESDHEKWRCKDQLQYLHWKVACCLYDRRN